MCLQLSSFKPPNEGTCPRMVDRCKGHYFDHEGTSPSQAWWRGLDLSVVDGLGSESPHPNQKVTIVSRRMVKEGMAGIFARS